MSVAITAMAFSLAGEAAAQCVCGCIDGQAGLICRGPEQVPNTCAPRTCPPPMPSTSPLLASSTPPPGTSRCFPAQVLLPQASHYVWMEVCR